MSKHVALYVVLGLALIWAAFPGLIKKRFVTPGERHVYQDAFAIFQLVGWLGAGEIVYLFLVLDPADPRMTVLLYCVSAQLMFPILWLLVISSGVLARRVVLSEIQLETPGDLTEFTRSNPGLAVVTHLSDGHIPEQVTMEGEIAAEDAVRFTRIALEAGVAHQSQGGPRFLFYTGDITDTGNDA